MQTYLNTSLSPIDGVLTVQVSSRKGGSIEIRCCFRHSHASGRLALGSGDVFDPRVLPARVCGCEANADVQHPLALYGDLGVCTLVDA